MPDAALTRPTAEPMALLRYLDVVLVIAALPFVAFAGLPLLGYAVGAGAWIAQRAAGALLERQAKRTTDVRRQVGLNLGGVARPRLDRRRRHPRRRPRSASARTG